MKTENKITCKHCGSLNVMKKGKRKLEGGKGERQIYSCKECLHRFSLETRKKRFDVWPIIDAVCAYHNGYSYNEVCEMIARKYKIKVGKSSVERWVKEYGLGYLDVRDMIISKHGSGIIVERMFNHSGLVYNFKFHKGKLKEYGKFEGLKGFISRVSTGKGVRDEVFNGAGESEGGNEMRCSQTRTDVHVGVSASENMKLNRVVGEMLKIVKNNRQRHMLVENLLLSCDRDTVAVEVPVWYWDKLKDVGVCGHIDVVQVRYGKVWIMDYKPAAEKEQYEKVVSQLYNYALALSFRTGVTLRDIMCAWFDSAKTYSFKPAEVVVR